MKPIFIFSILSFWSFNTVLSQHFVSIGTKEEALAAYFPDTTDVYLTLTTLKVDRQILDHFRTLNGLSKVSRLVVHDASIGKKELSELLSLLQRSLISISFVQSEVNLIESIDYEFPKLKELAVYNTRIPKEAQKIFSSTSCPVLRSLAIEECHLTPLRIRELAAWDILGQINNFIMSGDIEGTGTDNVALMLVQNLNRQSIEKIVLNRMVFELSSNKKYTKQFPALCTEIGKAIETSIDWSQFRALKHVELSFGTEDTSGLMKLLSDPTLRSLPIFVPPYPIIEFDFDFPVARYNIKEWQTSYRTLSQFYDSYFSVPLSSSVYRFPLTNFLLADRFLKSKHVKSATEVTLTGQMWHYHAITSFLDAASMSKLKTIRLESSPLSQRSVRLLMDRYPNLSFNVSLWPSSGSKYWPTLSQQ